MISAAADKAAFDLSLANAVSLSRRLRSNLLEHELVRFGLFFLFIAILLILRRPDAITNPQLLAEDGSLIFSDQFLKGSFSLLFVPYGGYFIVNTRLIGAFASLFPVLYTPLIYNIAAVCVAAFACSMFSLSWYRSLVASDSVRQAACILITCAVFTNVLVNELANTQWHLALIGLLLLARPASCDLQSSRMRVFILVLLSSLAALTGPALIVAVPVALWQIAFRKGRAKAVPTAMLAGCLLQVLCFFISPSTVRASTHVPVDSLITSLLVSTTYKVWIGSLAGDRAAFFLSANDYIGLVLIAIIFGTAWLVWLWFRLDSRKRPHMAVALYLGFGFILIALGGRSLWKAFLSITSSGEGLDRYFVLSRCILILLFAMTIEQMFRRRSAGMRAGVLLLLFSGGVIANYRVPSYPDRGWAHSAREIMDWRSDRTQGRVVAGLSIPLHPEDWFIRLLPTFRRARVISSDEDPVLSLDEASAWDSTFPLGKWRSTSDGSYLLLPAIFAPDTKYLIRADTCVASSQFTKISLYIHGRISAGTRSDGTISTGTRTYSAPQIVSGCRWIDTDYVTDPLFFLGPLPDICIHVRHNPRVAVSFKEIVLERK